MVCQITSIYDLGFFLLLDGTKQLPHHPIMSLLDWTPTQQDLVPSGANCSTVIDVYGNVYVHVTVCVISFCL